MGYAFDGQTKVISLTSGTTYVSIRDMYSRWKDWTQVSGLVFSPAFSVVGGDPIDSVNGIYVTSYFFLENGWKIRPQEASHKLIMADGILVDNSGSDPFIPTSGTYNVMIQYSQPIKSETISTGGSGGATPAQIWSYINRSLTDKSNFLIDGIKTKLDDLNDISLVEVSGLLATLDPVTLAELKEMLFARTNTVVGKQITTYQVNSETVVDVVYDSDGVPTSETLR